MDRLVTSEGDLLSPRYSVTINTTDFFITDGGAYVGLGVPGDLLDVTYLFRLHPVFFVCQFPVN